MTNLDDLERTMLSQARAFIEPTAADEARVFERLALGLGGAATISAIVGPSHGALARLQRWLVAHRTVALSCALLGAGFGAGFVVGQHSQRAAMSSSARSVEIREVENRGISTAMPSVEVPRPDVAAGRAPESPAALGSASGALAQRRALGTEADSNDSPQPASDPIGEELALLKRAERAIRAQNSLLALGLLRELEQRFPRGRLLAERAAARVMAECQQQPPDVARRTGNAYLRGASSSVYHERVRRLCGIADSTSNSRGVSAEKDSVGAETNPDSRRLR